MLWGGDSGWCTQALDTQGANVVAKPSVTGSDEPLTACATACTSHASCLHFATITVDPTDSLTGACYLLISLLSCDKGEVPTALGTSLKANIYMIKPVATYEALVAQPTLV